MSYVFISYSTKDARVARVVSEAFERQGIQMWMAPNSIPPGGSYAEEINDAIRNCDRVILLLSRASNASKYCQREIERAVAHGKPVIPVAIETFKPQGGLEFLVSISQTIDATATDAAVWLADVIAAAKSDIEAPAPPRRKPIGFIRIDPSLLAVSIAGVMFFAALVLSAIPTAALGGASLLDKFLPFHINPLGLGLGLALLAGVATLLRFFHVRRSNTIVVRVGDVVAVTAIIAGSVLFAAAFLFTPVLTSVLVGLAYLSLRKIFLPRWGFLLAAVILLVALSPWTFEPPFFRGLFDRGRTIAVVPDCDEDGCDASTRAYYSKLVDRLHDMFDGQTVSILPERRASQSFLDNADAFESDRPKAMRENLISHRRMFNTLVTVGLKQADCGGEKRLVTFRAAPVKLGDPPLITSWRPGLLHPIGVANKQTWLIPERDVDKSALLVAGHVLQYVASGDVADLKRNFLREVMNDGTRELLPDELRRELETGRFASQKEGSLDEVFSRTLGALSEGAAASVDHGQCNDALEQRLDALLQQNPADEPVDD